jgi:hypothetical protein
MTFFSTGTSEEHALGPEGDVCVDVVVERVSGRDAEDLMEEHVRLQRAEEEQRECAWIAAADGAGFHPAGEVLSEQAEDAARRHVVVAQIEGDHEGRGVHLHGDGRADDVGEERDQALREIGQGDARVVVRVKAGQRQDARGHGGAEERLFGVEVPEDGRGSDLERFGNVGQGGRREPARLEGGAGGVEDLFSRDARWTGHR